MHEQTYLNLRNVCSARLSKWWRNLTEQVFSSLLAAPLGNSLTYLTSALDSVLLPITFRCFYAGTLDVRNHVSSPLRFPCSLCSYVEMESRLIQILFFCQHGFTYTDYGVHLQQFTALCLLDTWMITEQRVMAIIIRISCDVLQLVSF